MIGAYCPFLVLLWRIKLSRKLYILNHIGIIAIARFYIIYKHMHVYMYVYINKKYKLIHKVIKPLKMNGEIK